MSKQEDTKPKTMLDIAHEMAQGLYKAGVINEVTLCESLRELSPPQIKRIRLHENVSQSVEQA